MKLSVAMCTYNGAGFVAEQLASIAAQTRLPDELVVCDDRSRDATVSAVERFAATAPFPVRLSVNERNLGSTANFGRAIAACGGELIALSDQDDVWLPEKLARVEEAFARAPRAGLVFTDAELVDERLRPLGVRLWDAVGFGPREQRLVRRGRALDVLLPGWTVTGATMAFRAQYRGLVLDIPAGLPMIHDGWIALLIAAVAEVEFIPEPLVKYRQHSAQQIGAPAQQGGGDETPAGLGGALEAARRVNSYAGLIEIAERARARLAERCGASNCGTALARLDSRLAHLRARAGLPRAPLWRAGRVLRELLALRYHRFSNGSRSALKDLLVKRDF